MRALIVTPDHALAQQLIRYCEQAALSAVASVDLLPDLNQIAIVLLDQRADGFFDACQRLLRSEHPHCQCILLLSDPDADALQALYGHYPFDTLPIPLPARAQVLHRLNLAMHQREQPDHGLASQQQLNQLTLVLNHLRIGTAVTDADGSVTFLNAEALRIFELGNQPYHARHWEEVFPFRRSDLLQLARMAHAPAAARERATFHLRAPGGGYYWVDAEVLDDPHDPARKLFFFYDVSEMHGLRRLLDEKAQFHDLVGKSKAMRQIYQGIQEVASVDMTVLIEGETGTGKELVARAIHSCSHRKDKPFIAVNCAGLTDSLLTSQLFGHRRGAFTGAIEDHKGVFEAANGGTLFLDEIGEIPLHVQTALLRVLQEREVTRVGDTQPRKVDVRLITATNRQLLDEVSRGTFRADFYYRIHVACIKTPPLRQRREDIPLLAGSLLTKARAATGKQVSGISDNAMRQLMNYPWPGNVRELVNAIEFAVMRCRDQFIQPGDLPPELGQQTELLATPRYPHEPTPRDRILQALERSLGNRKRAAQLLGMSRATFYRQLVKWNIDLSNPPEATE